MTGEGGPSNDMEDSTGDLGDEEPHKDVRDGVVLEMGKDGWGYLKIGAAKTKNAIVAVIGAIILVAIVACTVIILAGITAWLKSKEIKHRFADPRYDDVDEPETYEEAPSVAPTEDQY